MNNTQIAAVLRPDKPIEKNTNLTWVKELIEETGEWLIKREQTLHERETADTPEKELQKQLRLKFGLVDARVVPGGDVTDPAGYSALLKTYGVAAALYLDELVMAAEEHGDWLHVGFSGGQTVLDMATALIDRPRPQTCFYALAMIGRGSTNATSHVSPESNCTIAWSRSGRYPNRDVYSTVPPYHVNRADLRDGQKDMLHNWVRREIDKDIMELAARDPIAETLRRIQKISVAFAGLGLIQPSDSAHNKGLSHLQKLSMTDLLEPLGVDINRIEGEGAIGEISYCPFDADGIGQQDWNYFITAGYGSEHSGVDFYRDMVRRKKPVVVMAGFHKMVALLPALQHRLFNVLVTDAYTARMLLTADPKGAAIAALKPPSSGVVVKRAGKKV